MFSDIFYFFSKYKNIKLGIPCRLISFRKRTSACMLPHKFNPEFSMDIPLTTRIQYRTYMKLIIKNTLKNNIDKCLHVTDEMMKAEHI